MIRLYLMRHGDTGMGGRYIGSTDIGVSPEGVMQVQRTGRVLADFGISRVHCSPLRRCVETLSLLNLNGEVEHKHELREMHFGRWEGLDFSEVMAHDSELVDDWVARPETFCFPEGECMTGFIERLAEYHRFLNEQQLNGTLNNLLIVSHGGVIRHLLCMLLGLPLDRYLCFDVQAGAFSICDLYSEGAVLKALNCKG